MNELEKNLIKENSIIEMNKRYKKEWDDKMDNIIKSTKP